MFLEQIKSELEELRLFIIENKEVNKYTIDSKVNTAHKPFKNMREATAKLSKIKEKIGLERNNLEIQIEGKQLKDKNEEELNSICINLNKRIEKQNLVIGIVNGRLQEFKKLPNF